MDHDVIIERVWSEFPWKHFNGILSTLLYCIKYISINTIYIRANRYAKTGLTIVNGNMVWKLSESLRSIFLFAFMQICKY